MQYDVCYRPTWAPRRSSPIEVFQAGEEAHELGLLLIKGSDDGFHIGGRYADSGPTAPDRRVGRGLDLS